MIQEMIEIFGLKPYLNESAENLPLGFKQRLALSCALMHHPEVLFLDEPTSGVDPITRREFWNHINGLVEKGVTVMVTTHFMDEAEYCDRIGLVYRSKFITMGTPDELKEKAKTSENPFPTLEDAFIALIQNYDEEQYVRSMHIPPDKGKLRRLKALIIKEFYQIIRDPSSIFISFVLPLILMFIYGYGVSLDLDHFRIGFVLEDTSPDAQSFAQSIIDSRYFETYLSKRSPFF